jgi:hypothetical protein
MEVLSKMSERETDGRRGVIAAVADLHRDRSPPGHDDVPTDAQINCIDRIDTGKVGQVPGR